MTMCCASVAAAEQQQQSSSSNTGSKLAGCQQQNHRFADIQCEYTRINITRTMQFLPSAAAKALQC
jgi:hypothetical protein